MIASLSQTDASMTLPFPRVLVALAIVLGGCTTTSEIIIDTQGVNMVQYEQDKTACESYADQVAVTEKAVRGAGSGAAIGGATGAVRSGRNAGEEAAVGAILGGSKGVNDGQREQVRVVKNCLRGRGYRVLN